MSPLAPFPLTIEWSLLGFLAERPRYGYEIHQLLTEAAGLGVVWHIKQSQLYALLTRLEERGYIDYTLALQEGRPARKVYALTATGAAALETWLATPVERGRDVRLEFLAKVYFLWPQDAAALRTLCAAQAAECRAWLAELEAQMAGEAPDSYSVLVYRFRRGQVWAMLEWLESVGAE